MSEHHAAVRWTRTSKIHLDTYNRAHEVRFKDGDIVLAASSAPAFRGDADRVDPEEAFVASLSVPHADLPRDCARKRLTVDAYDDEAAGTLKKRDDGKFWIGHVTLRPRVRFGQGTTVDKATLDDIHNRSHAECFIANSVTTDVRVEPRD